MPPLVQRTEPVDWKNSLLARSAAPERAVFTGKHLRNSFTLCTLATQVIMERFWPMGNLAGVFGRSRRAMPTMTI